MERNVYAVLAEVQHRLTCPKGQYNKFGGFAYRSLEDINAALKPICTELRCGYTFSDQLESVYMNDESRFYIKATATFWADGAEGTVSVTAMAREQKDKKGMDDAQITGLASSYARKYAACGLFAIDSGEEVDALNNSKHATTSVAGRSSARSGDSTSKTKTPPSAPSQAISATDEQLTTFAQLMGEFAELRNKETREVLAAVNATKTMKDLGVTPATVHYNGVQADAANNLLSSWIQKAKEN